MTTCAPAWHAVTMDAESTHMSQQQLRNDTGALRSVDGSARLQPPINPSLRFGGLVRHRGTSGRSSIEILREMRGDR